MAAMIFKGATALGALLDVDLIEREAMQMDVEIGGRAETRMSVTAPVWASVRWSPVCWIRKVAMIRWTICKTGTSRSGCVANSKRSGIGNESTHCRTGTRRDTPYLLPPSLDDWLPRDHLARFVADIIDQLNLSALICRYRGAGSAAYHPAMRLGFAYLRLRHGHLFEPTHRARDPGSSPGQALRLAGVSLSCGQYPPGSRYAVRVPQAVLEGD